MFADDGTPLLDREGVKARLLDRFSMTLTQNQWQDWTVGGRKHDKRLALTPCGKLGPALLFAEADVDRWARKWQKNLKADGTVSLRRKKKGFRAKPSATQ